MHTIIVCKEATKITDDVYYVNKKGILARINPSKGECAWMDNAYWRYKGELIAIAETLSAGDTFDWTPREEAYTPKNQTKEAPKEPKVTQVTAEEAALLEFDAML
jgi:hypothetical protein